MISCLDLDRNNIFLVYSILCTMLKISLWALQNFYLKIKELPQCSCWNNSLNLKKKQCTQIHTYVENLTRLNQANNILVCDPTRKEDHTACTAEISNSNGTKWHHHPSAGDTPSCLLPAKHPVGQISKYFKGKIYCSNWIAPITRSYSVVRPTRVVNAGSKDHDEQLRYSYTWKRKYL